MHVKRLPEYGTERYYLLSELEQLTEFRYLTPPSTLPRALETAVVTYHFLWDSRNVDYETILQQIQSAFNDDEYGVLDRQRSSLCLQILVNRTTEDDWEHSKEKDTIYRLYHELDKSMGVALIQFGVADSAGADAALEGLHQWLEIAARKFPECKQRLCTICAPSAVQLLGFDPNREPDAVSGVFQLVISSMTQDEILRWLEGIIHANPSLSTPLADSYPFSSSRLSIVAAWLALIGVLSVLVCLANYIYTLQTSYI
jgi:hypothetical protein